MKKTLLLIIALYNILLYTTTDTEQVTQGKARSHNEREKNMNNKKHLFIPLHRFIFIDFFRRIYMNTLQKHTYTHNIVGKFD